MATAASSELFESAPPNRPQDVAIAEVINLPVNEQPADKYSLTRKIIGLPAFAVGGIARAAISPLDKLAYMNATDRERGSIETVTVNGREHLTVTSEPDPDKADSTREPRFLFAFPGLLEMADAGSAYRGHIGLARHNPNDYVTTIASDGLSRKGKVISIGEGWNKSFEEMAQDRLDIAAQQAGDSPSDIVPTSKAVNTAFLLARRNLDTQQLNLRHLLPISPALVACELNQEEYAEIYADLFGSVLNEEDIRTQLVDNFRNHVQDEALRTAFYDPKNTIGCLATYASAYLLSPKKFPNRVAAIAGNFRSATRGMSWSIIREVVSEYPIGIVVGERDSLYIPRLYDAMENVEGSNVKRIVKPNKGHFLSSDALTTASDVKEVSAKLAA